jgi:hypothetical protein
MLFADFRPLHGLHFLHSLFPLPLALLPSLRDRVTLSNPQTAPALLSTIRAGANGLVRLSELPLKTPVKVSLAGEVVSVPEVCLCQSSWASYSVMWYRCRTLC